MSDMYINVILALMIIVSFLGAIALHEFSHALMASWLGDSTPLAEGRQSLSLRTHLDPIGTLMCVILAFQPYLGMGFGWGQPVKPDPWKMKVGANAGILLVAIAGPVFSLLVGILSAVIASVLGPIMGDNIFSLRVMQFLFVFASVNICLTLFNLIPLYPLDGYQVVYTLLPSKQAVQFAKSAPYGPFIILALFFLLPFIARLSGLGAFPLFQLANYIWLGSMYMISLVATPFRIGLEAIITLYRL